jgi:hypothetical protein
MERALQLHPGQQALTPAQEAEAERFAEAYLRRLLSTEPVDEAEATALLRQAYQEAGLAAPRHIHWLDGPLQFLAVLAPPGLWNSIKASIRASVSDSIRASLWRSLGDSDHFPSSVGASLWANVRESVETSVGASLWASIREIVKASLGVSLWASVTHPIQVSLGDGSSSHVLASGGYSVYYSFWDRVQDSVRAYENAEWLALFQFFDVYLAPNALHALARFNQLVSGYWLGQEVALVVRHPPLLCRDAAGRLHNETEKCLEYHDGWGFYSWHGVLVPEQVILAPEELTREDFLYAWNMEARRIIQERMGEEFMSKLGGVVIDAGPRGILYEVELPADDPEGVARYVQVRDVSTRRQYFLRVPPTIQTAAEALAWSFGLSVEAYHPAQET